MCPFSHGVAIVTILIFLCAMHQVLGNPNSIPGSTTHQHVRRNLQGDSRNFKHWQHSLLQPRNHPSSRIHKALPQTPSMPTNVFRNTDNTNSIYIVNAASKLNINDANNETKSGHRTQSVSAILDSGSFHNGSSDKTSSSFLGPDLTVVGSNHSVFKIQPKHFQLRRKRFKRSRNVEQLKGASKKTRLLVIDDISRKTMTLHDRFVIPRGEENTKASLLLGSTRIPPGIQQRVNSSAVSDWSPATVPAISRLRDMVQRRKRRAQDNNSEAQRTVEDRENKKQRLQKRSPRKLHRENVSKQHKLQKAQEIEPSKHHTNVSKENNNLLTKAPQAEKGEKGQTGKKMFSAAFVDVLKNLNLDQLNQQWTGQKGDAENRSSQEEKRVQPVKAEKHVINGSRVNATEPVPLIAKDSKPISRTDYNNLKKFWEVVAMKKLLARQAQWAYVCMVGLLLLMMWALWYLGGLQRCRHRPDKIVYYQDQAHYMEMSEILRRRRKYLPMFNEPEWEEVLMTNRSTDP